MTRVGYRVSCPADGEGSPDPLPGPSVLDDDEENEDRQGEQPEAARKG